MLHRRYILLPLLLCSTPAIADPPATQPATDWQPPAQMPPLQPLLTDADYAPRRDDALSRIHRKQLADPARPLGGLLITRVDNDGVTHRLGVKPNAILAQIDNTPISPRLLADTIDSQQPYKVTLFQPGEGARTLDIPAGPMGIWTETRFAPAELYLRASRHDPRWDDDMLVAAANWQHDSRLSLAALQRAYAAGCRDPLLPALRAMIAFRDDDHDTALDFGIPCLNQLPPEAANRLAQVLCDCAVAAHHFHLAYLLAADHSDWIDNDNYLSDIDLARQYLLKLPPALALDQPPVRLIQTIGFIDLSKKLQRVPLSKDNGTVVVDAREWMTHKPFELAAPAGHYQNVAVGPPLRNLDFAVQFTCRPDDHNPSEFAHAVSATLEDYDAAAKDTTVLFRVSITPDLLIHIENAGLPDIIMHKPLEPGMATRHFRICLVGQRIQVLINGNSVYDFPFVTPEPSRHLIGQFYTVGYRAWLTNLHWREVKYTPPADTTPPDCAVPPLADYLMADR